MPLNLEREVESQLEHIPDYMPILLACSGGVDSMVLAHVLKKTQPNYSIAHCNFKLRGDEADADEQLVKRVAGKLGVEFFVQSFNTKSYAEQNGISIQMAARELRYNYFDELMQQLGYQFICTAHHLDDSLETLLLNFSRGTGISGLTQIGNRGSILRPLKNVSKESIITYAKKYKIEWREDASNQKTDYRRNAIRHFVLSSWRKAETLLDQGAKRSFQNLQSEKEALEFFLEKELGQYLKEEEGRQIFPMQKLRDQPYFEALLHFWLKDYGNFDYSAILSSEKSAGQQFDSNNFRLLFHKGDLILERQIKEGIAPAEIALDTKEILQPLFMRFEVIQEMRPTSIFKEGIAQLDFDKLTFPLILRPWRAGDVFVPLGMSGSKKLSDFFTDRKIDRWQRERTLVLCSGDEIVWVVGMRIADPYKVSHTTKNIYFVHLF